MKTLNLTGGWNMKHHEIPLSSSGQKHILVQVHQGSIRIGHHRFDVHNGSWSDRPKGQESHYIVKEGEEHLIHFDIKQAHGRLDKLFVSNHHLLKPAKISYKEMYEDKHNNQ